MRAEILMPQMQQSEGEVNKTSIKFERKCIILSQFFNEIQSPCKQMD